MQTFKRLVTCVLAICFFVACNQLAIFALEPYSSRVLVKWNEFNQDVDVDTVFIGNSLIEVGIVPTEFDDIMSTHSFNLGSSEQQIEESYLGLRTILEERSDIKTIVAGIEIPYLQRGRVVNPAKPFLRAKNETRSPLVAANDLQYLLGNRELLKSSDSINWLFPYVKNHVTLKPKNILENIQRKTSGTPNMLEAASKTSHINQFLGQGYFGSKRVCDFNENENQTYKDIFNYKPELKKEYVEILGDMCDLCREHDVDLVVIIPPLARFNAFDYGESWFLLTDQIRSVVESGGATFYDCNMLRTDYFSFDDSFYYNTQHLNVTGAKAFTKTLCQILQERQSDGDTQQFFYSPDEYRQSFDNVAFVRLTRKNSSGTNELTAQALVSPGIDVEYQFLVKKEGPSDDNWTVLRDYGPDSKCSFTPSEKGTYIIRVNTRTEGSNEDFQHYRTLKITR